MKKVILSFLLFLNTIFLFAGAGFFDSFAYANANASGNTFYDLGTTTGNPDFTGTNIGSFAPGTADLFLGGQTKTFKNNGTDVTGTSLYYRIYPVGSPSGAFTPIPYSFQNNIGGSGDQQWGTDINGSNSTDNAVNVLAGSTLPAGNYSLEVYVEITTNGVDAPSIILDNNGGANYIASFEITMSLPIELASFNAVQQKKSIQLNWITNNEYNNSHFDIQRSSDSKRWMTIEQVNGQGFSSEKIEYIFIDRQPITGTNYYRLKQNDFDDRFEYSDILSVNFGQSSSIAIQPNPANNEIFISGNFDQNEANSISIYNVNGQKILSTRQSLTNNLNVNNLNPGLYYLQIFDTQNNLVGQERFIKN